MSRALVSAMRAQADAIDAEVLARKEQARALRAQADLLERPEHAADGEHFVAKPAGVPTRTWRRAIRDGVLPAKLLGRSYVARAADVAAWLESHDVEPRADAPPPRREPLEGANDLERTIGRRLRQQH